MGLRRVKEGVDHWSYEGLPKKPQGGTVVEQEEVGKSNGVDVNAPSVYVSPNGTPRKAESVVALVDLNSKDVWENSSAS